MSAQSVTDAEPGVPVEDGPGNRLRAAREAKRLSCSQVAAELHLTEDVIRALERDEYDSLAGPVFVQGYLRKYARLLGESEELIIQAYHQMAPESQRHSLSARVPMATKGEGGLFGRLLLLLIIAAVIGAAVWKWEDLKWMLQPASQEAEAPMDEVEVPEQAAEELVVEPPPPVEAAAPPEVAPYTLEEAPTPPMEAEAVEPAVEVSSEPMPEEPEAAIPQVESAPEVDQAVETQEPPVESEPEAAEVVEMAGSAVATQGILLEFSASCWVDIRDASGKFKLLGNIPMGARRVLEGTPPYKVILGNSQAVKVTIDGEPFDLAPYSRGNVARFTLDPEMTATP